MMTRVQSHSRWLTILAVGYAATFAVCLFLFVDSPPPREPWRTLTDLHLGIGVVGFLLWWRFPKRPLNRE
jgi:hypothetical protein